MVLDNVSLFILVASTGCTDEKVTTLFKIFMHQGDTGHLWVEVISLNVTTDWCLWWKKENVSLNLALTYPGSCDTYRGSDWFLSLTIYHPCFILCLINLISWLIILNSNRPEISMKPYIFKTMNKSHFGTMISQFVLLHERIYDYL